MITRLQGHIRAFTASGGTAVTAVAETLRNPERDKGRRSFVATQ